MGRRDKKFVAEEEMYSPSGFLKQRPERGVFLPFTGELLPLRKLD